MMKLRKIDTEDMENELAYDSNDQLYLFFVFNFRRYDDTFNPLGMQDGGVHPPHEQTFFVPAKLPQQTKFP